MTAPTDGYGVYESVNTSTGSGTWGPRIDAIASAGFSLIMNYGLLHGHIADLIAYINYAATKSVKVIVALHDPRIWKLGTYSTGYPELYADSGNAATGTLFMQYIVGQLMGLAGVWGWYCGDEVAIADHGTFATYSAAIHTADATHPRLFISGSGDPTNSFGYRTSLFFDSCEVGGDDMYPLGVTDVSWQSLAFQAKGVQTFCTAKGIQSAFVIQAHSLQQYNPPSHVSVYPGEAPWPSKYQMRYERDQVLANMSPRLILLYSYFDALSGPSTQVASMSYGIGVGASENIVEQDTFWLADQDNLGSAQWTSPLKASVFKILGRQLEITGTAGVNYLIYGTGKFDNPIVLMRFVMTSASDVCGVIVRYTDTNNLTYVQVQNGLIQVVSIVGGVSTNLTPTGAPTITTSTAYWLRVTCSGATYAVRVWLDTATEPSSPTVSVTDTTGQATAKGKVGLYANVNTTNDQLFFDSFVTTYVAQTSAMPAFLY